MILQIITEIFAAYVITLVLTGSTVFESFRQWFKKKTPMLRTNHNHFIECRLCTGFWISTLVCLVNADIQNVFIIYGASYFLATQERK